MIVPHGLNGADSMRTPGVNEHKQTGKKLENAPYYHTRRTIYRLDMDHIMRGSLEPRVQRME